MTSIPADVQSLIAQEMALDQYESEADLLRDALDALRVETRIADPIRGTFCRNELASIGDQP